MKRPAVPVLFLALAGLISGCATADPSAEPDQTPPPTVSPAIVGPGDHEAGFLMPDGTERSYLMHAPPDFDPQARYPLVLMFHGRPGSPKALQQRSGMDEVADKHGFLVAYPDSFVDVESVAALLDHLDEVWHPDPQRIHAAGYSRGATFVYEIAEQLTERFGSVAPISGVAPLGREGASDPPLSQPLSLLTIQGAGDPLRHGFPETNDRWTKAAQCAERSVETFNSDETTSIAHSTTHVFTATCVGGAEHVIYSVTGIGHTWPAEASELIWEFFARHPLA